MSSQSRELNSLFKGTLVGKLSPHDASLEGMLAKLGVAWAGFFGGITLGDIFTLASLIYVLLNIYVLIRDKIILPRIDRKRLLRQQAEEDSDRAEAKAKAQSKENDHGI